MAKPANVDHWREDTPKWAVLCRWAEKVRALPEFDAAERDYKFRAIEQIAAARTSILAHEDAWLEQLTHGFRNRDNNITNWQAHDTFLKWAEVNPDAAQAALETLWTVGDSEAERIRAFLDLIPHEAIGTPGNRLSIASYLLMAEDPTARPPYKPTAIKAAWKLAGWKAPPIEPEDVVYEVFLNLCDELVHSCPTLRDRLDAQGALWAITKWKHDEKPEGWTDEEWAEFLAFRAGKSAEEAAPVTDGPAAGPAASPWGRQAHNYWLFQGNPRRFLGMREWLAAKQVGTGEDWTASRYADEMRPGDEVVVWMSGPDGGICATAELTGSSFERPNTRSSRARGATEPAVPLRVTRFVDPLISREECRSHDVLRDLEVLHVARATNYHMSKQQWDAVMDLLSAREPVKRTQPARALDAERLRAAADARGLRLDAEVYRTIVAALASGKHVMLTGAPGTAKTTLAELVAREAQDASWCAGHTLTTATADWTTYETLGGLRPTGTGELVFAPGHFLDAMIARKWLIIDELNRSNFDRAFGQLFTVLSGQWVQLPYDGPSGKPIALVPEGAGLDATDHEIISVPSSWRIVATMNVFDKSLLFEMSFALMRRFAFIEVEAPENAVYLDIIGEHVPEAVRAEVVDIITPLLELRAIKELGPALFIDMAKHTSTRLKLGDITADDLRFHLFYSYLLPQFEGINDQHGRDLYQTLRTVVGAARRTQLRTTLNDVLGLQLTAPKRRGSPSELEDLEVVDDLDEPDDESTDY
jgi:MoxR-like ATPase